MMYASVAPLFGATDASVAAQAMQQFIGPLMLMLAGIASLVCIFFLIVGGINYTASAGKPDQLEHAKRVIKNAIVGLVIVIAAGTLTSILSHAYSTPNTAGLQNVPSLTTIPAEDSGGGIVDVLIKAIIGLFKHIIEAAANPFIKALDFFTKSTPLMADNSAVFGLWLTTVAITDALFVLILGLLGFHVMSAATFGIEEIDFKKMLPQIGLTFLLINSSIFLIDMVISISNAMISALTSAFGSTTVWNTLSDIAGNAGGMGLVALMIMVVFLILSVMLLVYYVMRLVILYLGAVLAPFIALLYLLPGFRDFASTALKTYITTIFVLFVHVIILLLAASTFDGLKVVNQNATDTLMATVIGVATLVTLLKTQGLMTQWSYVSVGPRAMRKMGGQFMNGVHYSSSKIRTVRAAATRQTKASE